MTKQQEVYAFHYLSLIDMERTWQSLDARRRARNKVVKEALFRNAVVSYACPFSSNRGVFGGLKLARALVPRSLRKTHDKVIALRNKIVAHNDLRSQNLQFGPGTGFSVKGYASMIPYERLAKPLSELAHKVHGAIIREMNELEKGV